MIYNLKDGTVIEVTVSDSYSGPDGKPGCQRTSKNAVWWRLPQTTWVLTEYRTMHKFIEHINVSENLAAFLEGERRERDGN